MTSDVDAHLYDMIRFITDCKIFNIALRHAHLSRIERFIEDDEEGWDSEDYGVFAYRFIAVVGQAGARQRDPEN